MYKSVFLGSERPTHHWEHGCKVDSVCARIRQVIEDKCGETFFIPSISCLVKSSKTSVDEALVSIQKMRGK